MNYSEVFKRAVVILDIQGWYGPQKTESTPSPVCAMTATTGALTQMDLYTGPNMDAVAKILIDIIRESGWNAVSNSRGALSDDYWDVAQWNDAAGRTEEEVRCLLIEAARRYQETA